LYGRAEEQKNHSLAQPEAMAKCPDFSGKSAHPATASGSVLQMTAMSLYDAHPANRVSSAEQRK